LDAGDHTDTGLAAREFDRHEQHRADDDWIAASREPDGFQARADLSISPKRCASSSPGQPFISLPPAREPERLGMDLDLMTPP
jgi:hypothetical protein